MANDPFVDRDAMLKEAVYAIFLEEHKDILDNSEICEALQPDIDGIIDDVKTEVKADGVHWINALKDRSKEERETIIDNVAEILRGMHL